MSRQRERNKLIIEQAFHDIEFISNKVKDKIDEDESKEWEISLMLHGVDYLLKQIAEDEQSLQDEDYEDYSEFTDKIIGYNLRFIKDIKDGIEAENIG